MGLYEQLEDEVIADIARRVKNTGRYTETAELMAKSMVEQGYSADKIRVEVMKMLRVDKAYQMAVAENTKAYKQEIQDIIDQIVKEAKEAGNELVAEAGNMAWNNDLSMWEEHGVDLKKPNTMNQLLTAFKAQTVGELRNLTKSMGFKNTVLGTTGVLNAYQREMDLALLKVATGTFSYDQAVDDCVHRLAQSGLRSIDYASGRTYQIDTAARMSVRTGMSQLAGKIMEANLKSTGQDLVITSQHMGSRPEHAPWQNKVFSYSGKSKKYPDFFKETGYGTAVGLKGVNCTHDFYPFWEGSSVIPEDLKEPESRTINGKEYTYYEATQQQRRMERNIRATKREIEAQNAIGGSTTELKSKLRKQTNEYKAFSMDAGLKVRDNRLRVASGSSSISDFSRNRTGKRVVRNSKFNSKQKDYLDIQNASTLGELNELASKKLEMNIRLTQGSVEYNKKQLLWYDELANKYKQSSKVVGIGNGKMFGKGASAETFISPDGKTATITLSGKSTKQTTFDRLRSYGVIVDSKNVDIVDLTHEFAHTIASSKNGNDDFWNEIKTIKNRYSRALTKIDKQHIVEKSISYEESIKRKREIFISEYAGKSVDEFMAEAFSDALLTTEPSPYSKQVLEVVDKYFKKNTVENSNKAHVMDESYKIFGKNVHFKTGGKNTRDYAWEKSSNVANYGSIRLQKEEYARVMSNINTFATDAQRRDGVFSMDIDNATYTILYKGDYEYDIIGKTLIPDAVTELFERNKFE